jgi:transcriptional regulator with XRE-family HTH domain
MHENRVYIPEPISLKSRPMPKYTVPAADGFPARLTALRKAAGFTQAQLAAELGISRRRIAYYEAESEHPPASLLRELARVLNTTIDELLGSEPAKRKPRPASLSPRLERRLKQIEDLSPKPKQQLISIIDTFIAAEQNRRGSSTY